MPEALSQILGTEGLIWLFLAFSVAGVTRGFTGFGTAMIVMPVGALFLPMSQMIFIMTITGLGTSATLIPKAWGDASKREVLTMAAAAVVILPFSVSLLTLIDPVTLRWCMTAVIAVLITSLLAGWRFHGTLKLPGMIAIGLSAGLIGGATGLTGPAIILFYLASQNVVKVIRANTILFLGSLDLAIIVILTMKGLTDLHTFYLALFMTVPYVLATMVGQHLFNPEWEKLYRTLSYAIIVGIAIVSLPIFD